MSWIVRFVCCEYLLPLWLSWCEESTWQCRRAGFISGLEDSPENKKTTHSSIFLGLLRLFLPPCVPFVLLLLFLNEGFKSEHIQVNNDSTK